MVKVLWLWWRWVGVWCWGVVMVLWWWWSDGGVVVVVLWCCGGGGIALVVLDAINTVGLPFKCHSVLNSWFSTSANSSNPASAETIASDFSLT